MQVDDGVLASGVIAVERVLLAVELPGEPLRVVGTAVELAEHVALVPVTGPEAELRLGLLEPYALEKGDGARVEADEMCRPPRSCPTTPRRPPP